MYIVVHDIATFISLAATSPALTVCVLIMVGWWGRAKEYLATRKPDPYLMLIAGVWLGFAGSFLDNSWWGVAWSFDLYDKAPESREWWFQNGVFSNIVFRQAALIFAGMLHIRAEIYCHDDPKWRLVRVHKIMLASAVVGIVYAMWVLFA